MSNGTLAHVDQIGSMIRTIREQKVILDADLALIYGVPTKRLNEQIKRNADRFPPDFLFQLNAEETDSLRSQFATLKKGRGQHRKFLPYAFTENGAIMAANVLNSPEAVRMSVFVVRVPPLRDADARPAGWHEGTRAPTGRPGKEINCPSGCA
jgi:hypothetical protein